MKRTDRWIVVVLVVASGMIGSLVGGWMVSSTAAHAQGRGSAPKSVKTQSLVFVGASGRALGSITVGRPGVTLYLKDDNGRVVWSSAE